MEKHRSFTVILIMATLFLLVIVAEAQTEESKMEVGIQFSTLKGGNGDWYGDSSTLGGGGRFSYNLNKFLALEAEMNYFPGNGYYDVRRMQGQFGVKSGVRFNQLGIFGKVRPGFQRASYDVPVFCIQGPCPTQRDAHTSFSMDVGAVVEIYPVKHFTVRFDIGDTIVRNGVQPIAFPLILRAPATFLVPFGGTRHQLQISAGFGYRF